MHAPRTAQSRLRPLSLIAGLAAIILLAPVQTRGIAATLWWDVADDGKIRRWGGGPTQGCHIGMGSESLDCRPICFAASCTAETIEVSPRFLERFTEVQQITWGLNQEIIDAVKSQDPHHVAISYFLTAIVPREEELSELYYAHHPIGVRCTDIRKKSLFSVSLLDGLQIPGKNSVGDLTNPEYRDFIIKNRILPHFTAGNWDALGLDMYLTAFWWYPLGDSCTADKAQQLESAKIYLQEMERAIEKPITTNQITSDAVLRSVFFKMDWDEAIETVNFTRAQMMDIFTVYPRPTKGGGFSGQGILAGSEWVDLENFLLAVLDKGKAVMVNPDLHAPLGSAEEEQARLYALGSFLLFKNGVSFYSSLPSGLFTAILKWVCSPDTCPPERLIRKTFVGAEFLLDLGLPITTATQNISSLAVSAPTCLNCSTDKAIGIWGREKFTVYVREYEKGYVIVNPSSEHRAFVTIPFSSAMRNKVRLRGWAMMTISGEWWFPPVEFAEDGLDLQPRLFTEAGSEFNVSPKSALILLREPVAVQGP